MSSLLVASKGSNLAKTPQRTTIVDHKANNVLQWSKGVSAAPKSCDVGTTTAIDVKFNSRDFEQEVSHFLTYDLKNASATEAVTFLNGALNHWEEITIIINDATQKIEIENLAQVREIVADYYLEKYGLDIWEGTSFIRNEFNTFNGITVGTSSTVKFYYDLSPFIEFAKTTIKGQILNMRIELKATAEPANAAKAAKLFKSSTTSAAYTAANITFQNINYVRQFAVVQNPSLLVGFLSQDAPVRKVHWKVTERVMYTGSWLNSNSDSTSFKLSDVRKANNIQFISCAVRPIPSAYNDAESCKQYSGYHWIGWLWRELNTSEERELDMTDSRLLREHEFQQYHNEYGRFKQLPIEVFTDSANLFSKYYLNMTKINFDYLQLNSDHEVVRNTSSISQDYDLTFYANGDVGANCEFVVRMVQAEVYEFDKKSGQMFRVQ